MLFDGRQAERFAELLDNASPPRQRSRSRSETQLVELASIGDQLGGVRVSGPTADFRSGLRAQLLAAAERDGIGVTAVDPQPAPAPPRRTFSRTRIAILAGVAGGALAGFGIWMISGGAHPGDPLYSVKRSTETIQLALAGSDLSRGQLYLEFARTRAGEAHAVRADPEDFGAAMGGMDADTSAGVRLLTTSAMAHQDASALDVIDRFVYGQRSRVTRLTSVAGASSRAKVDTSLTLLDAVAVRSHSLRDALACRSGAAQKSDSLGPLAAPCPTPATARSLDSGPAGESGRIRGGPTGD